MEVLQDFTGGTPFGKVQPPLSLRQAQELLDLTRGDVPHGRAFARRCVERGHRQGAPPLKEIDQRPVNLGLQRGEIAEAAIDQVGLKGVDERGHSRLSSLSLRELADEGEALRATLRRCCVSELQSGRRKAVPDDPPISLSEEAEVDGPAIDLAQINVVR